MSEGKTHNCSSCIFEYVNNKNYRYFHNILIIADMFKISLMFITEP